MAAARSLAASARASRPPPISTDPSLLPRLLHQLRASGGGWRTDYPGADNNFSVRLAELTRVHVKLDERPAAAPRRRPAARPAPLPLSDGLHGRTSATVQLTPPEVLGLREFLLKGGFLWVDDSWGSRAWNNWVEQIARVLPPGEFPIVDIERSHPIMRTLYDVQGSPAGAQHQLLVAQRAARRRSGASTARRSTSRAFRTRTAA